MDNRRKNRIDNEDYEGQVKRPKKNTWRCECDFVLSFVMCYLLSLLMTAGGQYKLLKTEPNFQIDQIYRK